MKKVLFLIAILFTTLTYAQSECKPYVPNAQGDKWEVTSYSPKDKVTGKVAYELITKTETDSSSTFTIKAISYDAKGKEMSVNTYDATCKNGKFIFDMAMTLDPATMAAYKDMEVEVDATDFEIPPMDTTYSGELEDGTMNISIASNGAHMFTMTILIYDREIESIEELTTTAGTFTCMKMNQKVRMKAIVKVEGSSTEWYSEGVGMVRSESYNAKGKLTGYTLLTKFGS